MDTLSINKTKKIRVPKNSYKILRESLTSEKTNRYQPVEALEMASLRRHHNSYPACLSHSLNSCTKVLMAFLITISFLYVVLSLEATAHIWKNSLSGSQNLLLTPYINDGNISEARELSKVSLFPGITSYSGFLTIDEPCKTHLFFWFFPAASGNITAPLILWHGGGPGTSGLFGLFQGTGPVRIDEDGKSWIENKYAWTEHRSMLYLDSPVGTGFSYNENDDSRCYASSSDDVADGALRALRQFYQLFPEYQRNDFYISTTSYGGKFAPTLAWRIHYDNQLDKMSQDSNLSSINLKGVISMSGFSDPLHQIDYGEFYYNLGFIDSLQFKFFQSRESLAKSFIRSKHFYDAYEIVDPLIVGNDGPSYLKNITGIKYPYNFVTDLTDPDAEQHLYKHDIFLGQKWVEEAIHVDTSTIGHPFRTSSNVVYMNLLRDLYKSVSHLIEDLLNADDEYKFLFTAGQMDLIVPHTTVAKFLQELKWGKESTFKSMLTSAFAETNADLWMYKGQVVGYGKNIGKLTYLMMRKAGHHPFIDQPEWTLDLVLRFTQ